MGDALNFAADEPLVAKHAVVDGCVERAEIGSLVSIRDALQLLQPLDIECRLVCRARRTAPAKGPVMRVTATDLDPLIALHERERRPSEGRSVEKRL